MRHGASATILIASLLMLGGCAREPEDPAPASPQTAPATGTAGPGSEDPTTGTNTSRPDSSDDPGASGDAPPGPAVP